MEPSNVYSVSFMLNLNCFIQTLLSVSGRLQDSSAHFTYQSGPRTHKFETLS
jgi:hypothetical protein